MLRKQTQKADADSKQNPFVQDVTPNKSDVLLIAIAFLIGITFFIGSLQSQSIESAGAIYLNLTFIVFILIVLAAGTKFNVTSWVFYGSTNNFFNVKRLKGSLFVMLFVGIALALFLQVKPFGLSIGIPLSISETGTTLGSWYQYSIVSFYGPLMEELFWIGLLLPSFLKYSRNTSQVGELIFLVLGIFLILLGVEYTGIMGIVFGAILFLMAGLLTIKKIYTPLNRLPLNSPLFAIPIAALALVLLHAYSYGNFLQNWQLFFWAEMFFIIEGVVDFYFRSIVPSIMMHTVNNAVAAQTILEMTGLSLGLFTIQPWMLMTALMALLLIAIFRVRYIIIKGQSFAPFKYESQISRGSIRESSFST